MDITKFPILAKGKDGTVACFRDREEFLIINDNPDDWEIGRDLGHEFWEDMPTVEYPYLTRFKDEIVVRTGLESAILIESSLPEFSGARMEIPSEFFSKNAKELD